MLDKARLVLLTISIVIWVGWSDIHMWAQVPNSMTYSGQLTTPQGEPREGTFNMWFRIYDRAVSPPAVGLLHTWQISNVLVRKGQFSVLLENLPPTLFTEGSGGRYMEVQVQQVGRELESPMIPRQPLVSVPYAQRSPAPRDEIRLHTSSRNGSTGVRVKVFDQVFTNTGSAMTYNPSSVNGDSITINTAGVYAISFTGAASGNDIFGISVNASSTTQVQNLAPENVLCMGAHSLNIPPASCAWTGTLNAGDVIRPHQSGATAGTATLSHFEIMRLH